MRHGEVLNRVNNDITFPCSGCGATRLKSFREDWAAGSSPVSEANRDGLDLPAFLMAKSGTKFKSM
jgi:hypothetical protein